MLSPLMKEIEKDLEKMEVKTMEEKTYKIIHKEELIGWFYVDATSEEEALEKFHMEVDEFDFSDMDLVDSEDIAVELENNSTHVQENNKYSINVGFINDDGISDETQIDVEKSTPEEENMEIINTILSLRKEMNIREVTYLKTVPYCE